MKIGKPCKHPDKMRYSLESTGVDCNFLSEELFGISLLWFKNGKAPENTCCMCGLMCNSFEAQAIKYRIEKLLNEID